MNRSKKALIAAIGIIVALVLATVAVFVLRYRRAPDVPAELVPPSWEQFKTSAGHVAHVGMDGVACKDCHSYETQGFKNPGSAPCAKCHAKEDTHTHGGGTTKTDCVSCHAFAPNKAMPTCIGCHAQVQGHSAAVKEHATTACTSCHKPHGDPAIVPADCGACHKEKALSHAAHSGSKGCLDCHRAHAPASTAPATCSTCHKAPSGPKPAGHDACITCHKPHDFAADAATLCVGCHGVKPTLMAATVKAHTVCTTCHTPHAPSAAAADASCAACHSDVKVSHAGKQGCIDCHTPHSATPNAVASVACTSCHKTVATSDMGTHAGKTPCAGCHKPHDFTPPNAQAKVALCTGCHARETTLTATNRGHAACTTCHGTSTHKPTAAPACASCHAKEQATAPAGHQKCVSCHEPHAGTRVATATCATCHANKTGKPHDAVKGGCTTCHSAHGPNGIATPPKCATCHVPAKLPALHSVAAHAECTQCHTSHAPPKADRAACTTSCHADRKTHQPDAKVCSGCHVFRR